MKIKLKNVRNSVLVIAFVLLFGGIGYYLGKADYFNSISKQSKLYFPSVITNKNSSVVANKVDFGQFWEVWGLLEDKYYNDEKIVPENMLEGAINGMVSSLKDPWTVYLPPKEKQRAKEDLNGQFEGVGIQLGYKDEKLAVIAPLKGMPAEKVGVRAGDFIRQIKDAAKDIDINTSEITIYEAVEYIRGPKGSVVELTLQHQNEEPYVAAITRGTIVVPSVELKFGNLTGGQWQELSANELVSGSQGVAILKLNRFGDNTLTEWSEAVSHISQAYDQGLVKGMILDIRNNPGGYLTGAVSLSSEFLDKGVVVKQENADKSIENYSVNRRGELLDIPLVVLVNEGSASASEIVAGALRHYDRAVLVGETTFGKGTIQEALDLEGEAALHVTTAKWLMPDGSWLKTNEGLVPDLEVVNPEDDDTKDLQLEKAVEQL